MHLPHWLLRAWVLTALLAPLVLVLTSVLARLLLRARLVARGSWVVVELKGAVTDVPPHVPRWRLLLGLARPAPSVAALRRLADRIARDGRVEGVVLRVGELACGWATAASVRDVVRKLRASGKRVVAYLPYGGTTRELYVALAAERVLASPQATLSPLGVTSGMSFYRTLLARGGVDAEMLARREFKSAAESFTRDGYSEANRQQLSALLDTLHGALVRAIAEGRNKSEDDARALVDGASYRGREALERGLIDGLCYDDELSSQIDGRKTGTVKLVPAARYAAARMGRTLPFVRRPRGKRVAVVEVRGSIVAESPVALGRVADSRRVIGALRAARAHRGVGAVVLYVDSPGGSALASDLIAREVERLKEKKPVVAYFSDTAASGGYYVSALANEIVAQPVTVTGSIGVIALRFVFEKTLEKLGITHEVIRRGARADLMSPYRHWTDEERALLDREIDGFYSDFVALVARGRGRTAEQVEPLARGRVYSGADAHAVGLVDTLGGLDVAVARAAERAGLDPTAEPIVVHPPRHLPEPPEPPVPLQPIVSRLGGSVNVLNLALACERERLFVFDDRVAE